MKSNLELPHHYQYLESYVDRLLEEQPFDRNVFLMVRYQGTQQLHEIRASLVRSLRALGLNPLLAGERAYHPYLWDNICVHMLASRFGVAVFEEIDTRDYNPNIAIELGFMIALGRSCLPVDIGSLIYKEFDSYDVSKTIEAAVSNWVTKDLALGLTIDNIFGEYRSEWGRYDEMLSIGTAVITGSSNEINIVVHDERASSYTAKAQIVGNRILTASWVNVDFPNDYGRWEASISEDSFCIEGRWTSATGGAWGLWRLTRI